MRVVIATRSPGRVRCNKEVSLAAENRHDNSQRLVIARNKTKAVGTQLQLRRTRAYFSCMFPNMLYAAAYDGKSKAKNASGSGTELRNNHQDEGDA